MDFFKIIFSSFLLLSSSQLIAQQYFTETMVRLAASSDAVQEYFKTTPTIFIRSNDWVNEENCRIGSLSAPKMLLLLTDEELEIRQYERWMEFGSIKRNGNEGIVRLRFHKNKPPKEGKDKKQNKTEKNPDASKNDRKEYAVLSRINKGKPTTVTLKFIRERGRWKLKDTPK